MACTGRHALAVGQRDTVANGFTDGLLRSLFERLAAGSSVAQAVFAARPEKVAEVYLFDINHHG